MNTFINYLTEVNLALIFFFVVYAFFLKNENQFAVSRYFLLAGMVLSLLLPLIHLGPNRGEQLLPSVGNAIPTYWLPEQVTDYATTDNSAGARPFTPWTVAGWTYGAVAGLMLLLLIVRIAHVARMIYGTKKYAWRSCQVTESEDSDHIFSFFHFIFIGRSGTLTTPEKERVLEHEWVHVKNYHSLDILLINILSVICWFNPIVFYYKKELVQLHEFEADARSVEDSQVDTYCQLMAKVALEQAGFSLVNHFHNSLTLKRITMMKTLKRKIQPWKIAALAVSIPVIFFVVSCQEQVMTDLNTVAKNSGSAAEVPPAVLEYMNTLKARVPGRDYNVLELNDEGLLTLKKLMAENPDLMNSKSASGEAMMEVPSFRYEGRNFAFIPKGKAANRLNEFTAAGSGDVHAFAEVPPQFPGGIDSMVYYFRRNLKYPGAVGAAKPEGRVMVQFIVEEDGRITSPEVLKGFDPMCNKAAVEIVSRMPNWIPGQQDGKPVRVKFVVPITFKAG